MKDLVKTNLQKLKVGMMKVLVEVVIVAQAVVAIMQIKAGQVLPPMVGQTMRFHQVVPVYV